MNDLFRAVLYARVSTDDKGQTNETQIRAMEDYCRRENWEVVSVHQDEMTGTTLDRPGLKRAMADCMFSDPPVDILLAVDQSRLTRSGKIEEIRAKIAPTKIRFVTMSLDSDSDEGFLVNGMKQVTDTLENRIRSTKTKSGMETRRLQGIHCGSPAKFMFTEDSERSLTGDFDIEHGGCSKKGRFKAGYTVTYPLETAMSRFSQGVTIAELAHELSLLPCYIWREVKRKNLLQKYHEMQSEYHSNRRLQKGSTENDENPLQKGLIAKGYENTDFSDCERVSSEPLQKGTVLQNPIANTEGEIDG